MAQKRFRQCADAERREARRQAQGRADNLRADDRYKTNAAGRSLAKVVLAAGEFGRPLVAPPGTPADRFKILRDAFDKSVSDPALLAAAEKRRLEMDPASGAEIEALAKEVIAATPDVVQRMQKLLGGENRRFSNNPSRLHPINLEGYAPAKFRRMRKLLGD